MKTYTVYLAGGMHSGWQEVVKAAAKGVGEWVRLCDPCSLSAAYTDGSLTLEEIARIELMWLDRSDMVFAYLEKDNPSGLGMSAEIGYAVAKGKRVIFVDERDDRYSAYLRCLVEWSTTDFNTGLKHFAGALEDMYEWSAP